MNYYFIDFENVGSEGVKGINKLDADSTVFFFYSKNADKITFELHIQLSDSKANIQYHKVEVDHKNALDFQLSSYLGYVIRENKDSEASYFIVSKDSGFASLVPFWKKRKINIELVTDISGQHVVETVRELEQQVVDLTKDTAHAAAIANIIKSYKTKQGINNALVKIFGDTKKAGEVYKTIKSLLTDKKGA
ncbi:MAG: hypothetical protein IJP53_08865 [Synergistaceae bacterium]|nr:hypothetical protein [Synergistaceae bacterium]